jgi:hypothetical protein
MKKHSVIMAHFIFCIMKACLSAAMPDASCFDELLPGWEVFFDGKQGLEGFLLNPDFENFLDRLSGPGDEEPGVGDGSGKIAEEDRDVSQEAMKKQRARRRSINDASTPAGESTNGAVASQADNSINKCFKCSYKGCSFSCSRKYHLNRHAFVHISEKPYLCKYPGCSYSATRKSRLLIHECMHTGKKPYVCTYSECSYSSTRKTDLVQHQRVHWGETIHFVEGQNAVNCL